MWGHIVAAVSVVFDTTDDTQVLEKAINGFHLCATIASYYVFSDVLDNLVVSTFFPLTNFSSFFLFCSCFNFLLFTFYFF